MAMKRKKKRPDIMDLVVLAGAAAVRQVDELGFSFLAEHGYDVTGWDSREPDTAKEVQARLAAAMEERGETLCYHGAVDDASPRFIFWYTLRRGKQEIAKSRVLQFVQREK